MLSDVAESSFEAFELCFSVWSLILSHCPEKEVSEVRRVLGASLIEQASDLREEVSTLLEIWRQVKEDQNISSQPPRQLAEPPELRQRLIQEIVFFVEHLKKRSKRQFIDSDKNRDILHYVENEASRSGSSRNSRCDSESGSCVSVGSEGCGSRPHSSVSSQDGRLTPLRPLTPGGPDRSQLAALTEKVDYVNALDIDSVIDHLRQALKDECEQHRRDIEFLQSYLEGDQQESLVPNEPTIRELRNFGTQLERAVLEESRVPTPTLSAKPKLLPLSTMRPHPPSAVNCGSQSFSRASQVKRRDSRQAIKRCDMDSIQVCTEENHPLRAGGSSPVFQENSIISIGCSTSISTCTKYTTAESTIKEGPLTNQLTASTLHSSPHTSAHDHESQLPVLQLHTHSNSHLMQQIPYSYS